MSSDSLAVVVEGKVSDPVASALRSAVDELAGRRSWVLGPPHCDDDSAITLPVHADHLDEVQEVLGEVCRISARHDVSFDVYHGPEMIGSVRDGRMDEFLKVCLTGEWGTAID